MAAYAVKVPLFIPASRAVSDTDACRREADALNGAAEILLDKESSITAENLQWISECLKRSCTSKRTACDSQLKALHRESIYKGPL